jgi:hypothetical protein
MAFIVNTNYFDKLAFTGCLSLPFGKSNGVAVVEQAATKTKNIKVPTNKANLFNIHFIPKRRHSKFPPASI